MVKDGYPYLNFGYDKLPPTYPPGLSGTDVSLAEDPSRGRFHPCSVSDKPNDRPAFAPGHVWILRLLEMPLTGGFAALLLATLPGFFTFCRSSMSEISASALIVLAFMFAYLGLKEERRWKIYLSAIFLGLSLNIRAQALFFAPLLLAMALFPVQGRRLSWFLHCFALMPSSLCRPARPLC